jgi:flagellar hook-associated protein 2
VPGSYAVDVTRLATQASLAGGQVAGLTITAGVNDQLDVNVDGTVASITLSAGTYGSAEALAAEVQSKLNGAAGMQSAGNTVSVSQTAGVLNITSARYGSASSVSITGGNGAADLVGASPTTTAGVDVTGTINGAPATGLGQTLLAATGDHAEGLRVDINGGVLGSRGNITFSRGYADQLNKLVGDFLTSDGMLASRTDGLNASIKDLDKRQDDFNDRLAAVEARYRAQFTALDTMLSSLNQTSAYMTQQLSALQNNN